ncbi:MAG: DNA polymerase III subunit chi [Alphaproteobacteria bacterium]|nr:DNA polymerase III subunit chi [Alphaproteobacteria bacterium]
MTEIRFYHLTNRSLEDVLPVMLERTVVRDGKRAIVLVGSPERVEHLNAHLWTYNDRGFLPHGSKDDGAAELQPIWLTDGNDNPNGAKVLFLADGGVTDAVDDYDLVCTLFDGRDSDAVAQARERWRAYQAQPDYELTYWQQTDNGGWEKKADS